MLLVFTATHAKIISWIQSVICYNQHISLVFLCHSECEESNAHLEKTTIACTEVNMFTALVKGCPEED